MSTTPQADDHRTPAAETPRQSAESARENPCTEPSGGETSAPFTCYVVRIISSNEYWLGGHWFSADVQDVPHGFRFPTMTAAILAGETWLPDPRSDWTVDLV